MVALLIVSGVLVYAFIGIVVSNVWAATTTKKCGADHKSRYNRCEHEEGGWLAGLLWVTLPFLGLLYVTCIALSRSGNAVSRRLVK